MISATSVSPPTATGLVLSVVVIFSIVTLTHVVRRSRDLATTLLAVGVGLLVTIGPLVLLAT